MSMDRPRVQYRDDWDKILLRTELHTRDQWVVWKYEIRDGKWTKAPYRATNPMIRASHSKRESWGSFTQAMTAWARRDKQPIDGIGYVFSEDDPYCGADFDHCIGPDGEILEWALPWIGRLAPTFGDISPSGSGIKYIIRGKLPDKGRKRTGYGPDGKGAIEVYCRLRFFTLTGNPIDDCFSIEDRAEALAELYEELGQREAKKPKGSSRASSKAGDSSGPLSDDDVIKKASAAKNGPKFVELFDRGDTSGYGGDESRADCALAMMLAFWCANDEAQMERLFSRSALGQRDKWRDRADYREQTIDYAVEQTSEVYRPRQLGRRAEGQDGGQGKGEGEPKPANGNALKTLVISTKQYQVNNEAIEALGEFPNIYVRGNTLATIVRTAAKQKSILRPPGSPRIVPIAPARLREILTMLRDWQRAQETKEGTTLIPAHPPEWCIQGILARESWPDYRALEAVVEAPVLRPDGSILDKPGWDEATALYYEPNALYPIIPTEPTWDQAREAAQLLLRLVCDFPFKDDHHRSVWLAGVLEVFARFAIDGPCPLILFDANAPGSGKTKLTDLIAIITTNRDMARTVYPDNDEEMRKRITSVALAGDRLMLIDNIASTFGGPSLDSVLTGTTWRDRVLGRSEMTVELPMFTCWFGGGNNVSLRGDALRRVFMSRLETPEENPEDRSDFTIQGDLLKYARKNRPALVAAALTILRAHAVAGRPTEGRSLIGSYESWCEVVRNAVVWSTGFDPAETRKEMKANDPEAISRAALIEGWAELPNAHLGLTVAEAMRLLKDEPGNYDTLRSVMLGWSRSTDLPSPRSVGMRLNAIKGRIIGGKAIQNVPDSRVQAWRIVAGKGANSGPGCGTNATNGTSSPRFAGEGEFSDSYQMRATGTEGATGPERFRQSRQLRREEGEL